MKTKPSSQPRTLYSQLLALAAGTLIAAAPLTVLAAAGDLDTTFGNGAVTTTIGTYAGAYGVAIQSDGKIVAVGYTDNGPEYDFAVARYSSDGDLDSGFGVGGVATTSFTTDGDYAWGVVIQSDGKIVVAGYDFASFSSTPNFAVARYNSNGSLDTSFSSDGKAETGFGADDYGRAVALQTDGKIVVAGYTNNSGNNDFAVARYNTNGSQDTSFDTDGEVTTSFGNDDRAYAVFVQPDGKIVAAGYWDGGAADFAVVRYNSNGSLDTSFSGDGKANINFGGQDFAYAAARQSDGKIVLAGCTDASGNYDTALARLNTDGSLDSTFGSGGKVTTAADASLFDCADAVAIQSDGKIVVTGYVAAGGFGALILVVRYNSNGSLDTGFGSGGIVITGVSGIEFATAVAIQSDGKIVVAGGSHVTKSFILLRYEGVTAAPPPPTTLPVPVGANIYACEAVPTNPVVSATPASADPMGVSNPTATDVRVTLQTAAFAAAVDVYVTARLADGSTVIRTPTGWFPYPATTTPLFALQTAAIDMTSAASNLYASPLSALPPGNYQGNVIVVPTGTGIGSAAFYNWCYTKTF